MKVPLWIRSIGESLIDTVKAFYIVIKWLGLFILLLVTLLYGFGWWFNWYTDSKPALHRGVLVNSSWQFVPKSDSRENRIARIEQTDIINAENPKDIVSIDMTKLNSYTGPVYFLGDKLIVLDTITYKNLTQESQLVIVTVDRLVRIHIPVDYRFTIKQIWQDNQDLYLTIENHRDKTEARMHIDIDTNTVDVIDSSTKQPTNSDLLYNVNSTDYKVETPNHNAGFIVHRNDKKIQLLERPVHVLGIVDNVILAELSIRNSDSSGLFFDLIGPSITNQVLLRVGGLVYLNLHTMKLERVPIDKVFADYRSVVYMNTTYDAATLQQIKMIIESL